MLLQTILAVPSAVPPSIQASNGSFSNVTLSYGQYQGTNLPGNVTEFLGVRYANTPQRFSASGPPTPFTEVIQATQYGPGCQGSGSQLSPGNSEDCLFADIYTPTAAIQSDSTAKLPVFVFIQGGGLTDTLGRFNGTGLLSASNLSIITVTFTYRSGPFGFLASREVLANGTLNAGLLDQLQLLQWVKQEITHFGGDASRVTLGGQSAGAGCALNHLTANETMNSGLFQAAILQSTSSPPVRQVSEQQFQYDNLVNATQCSGQDTLACLRGLTTDQLLAGSFINPYPGNTGVPVFGWHIVVDGIYVNDSPLSSLANGKVSNVPIVIGSVTDEGTVFTPRNISNSVEATAFIKNNYPNVTQAQLDNYIQLYNFGLPSSNYWLKASSSYGETRYICPSIYISSYVPTWNYRYNISTADQIASLDGASHGSDLSAIWAPTYGSSDQIALLQGPANQTLQWIQGYWISFIQTYNPNINRILGSPDWPVWTASYRFVFNVTGSGTESVDQAQCSRCNYLGSIEPSLEQ